jgi:hypothetical protein
MARKRILLVVGAMFAVFVLVGALGVTAALAQEPTPPTDEDDDTTGFRWGGVGRGFGGRGFFSGNWTAFDAVAEALGLTPDEFFEKSHDEGMTLEEIADELGVDLDDVRGSMAEARLEAMRERIEQAVEDGTMSAEQAEWLLEGMEQGFCPMMGRGGSRGGGRGWRGFSESE